jgi:hypothetical protein
VNGSRAKKLLARTEVLQGAPNRLRRHLLVAAALREVLARPIIVGGTAEDYWTPDEYGETDLDLCVSLHREDVRTLTDLGFELERGRPTGTTQRPESLSSFQTLGSRETRIAQS